MAEYGPGMPSEVLIQNYREMDEEKRQLMYPQLYKLASMGDMRAITLLMHDPNPVVTKEAVKRIARNVLRDYGIAPR